MIQSTLLVEVLNSDIILTCDVTVTDGVKTDKVEFFSNGVLIGTVLEIPYRYVWKDVPPGTYNQLNAICYQTQTLKLVEESNTVTAVIEKPGIFANPQSIIKGQSVTISFISPSANFHSVRINGVKPGTYVCDSQRCKGSYTFNPQSTTTYTLTANNDQGVPYPPMSVTVPVTNPIPIPNPNPSVPDALKNLPRVTKDKLMYMGAMRPPILPGEDRFGYGCYGMSYDNNSLWLTNHDWQQEIAQISIPTLVKDTSYDDLPISQIIQYPKDPSDNLLDLQALGWRIGGTLIWKGKLYFTVYIFYDASFAARKSHFISSMDLNELNDAKGPYNLNAPNPGFVGGYMSLIPEQWRPYMGSPCLTGQSSVSIISRTSSGPSAFGFDPETIGLSDVTPTIPYVYYPVENPTLGSWDNGVPSGQYGPANPMWNMATKIYGVAFPKNKRSMLFFGRTGLGQTCYGSTCYPGAGQSPHSEPYTFCVWEYDIMDMIDVRNNIKKPWEIIPQQWMFELPFSSGYMGEAMLTGVGYDGVNDIIYVGHNRMEQPVIHGFKVI